MAEGIVKANGIDIWYETFGDPSHPTVLLIAGAFSQALLWAPEFCQGLVDGGRHVVWYDNRDIGLSEWPDEPYTLEDMADDAVGLLDALGIGAAHMVGASMGGMIAQLVALRHPGRTLSLTSIMSSPGMNNPAIEPRDEERMAKSQEIASMPADDRDSRIAQQVEMYRLMAGPAVPFEEEYWGPLLAETVDRAWHPECRHVEAINGTASWLADLPNVTTPTLVIHGTADYILPYSHGVATTDAIPGARMLTLEGVGHELPRPLNDKVIGAILDLTGNGGTDSVES